MKNLLLVLTSLFVLSACGDLNQDPLEGAPENVRNGRPEQGKVERPTGIDESAVKIDAPQSVEAVVGSAIEFKISGRILVDNPPGYEIHFDNLDQFPAASFDPATGIFHWIPTKNVLGSEREMTFFLNVRLVTLPTEKFPVRFGEPKSISIKVKNVYQKPIVASISGEDEIGSGANRDTYFYDFVVEDRDAASASDVTVDVRNCAGSYYYGQISAFASRYDKVQPDGAKKHFYKGKIRLDLSDARVESGLHCFSLVAINRNGDVSDAVDHKIYVEGAVEESKITLSSAVSVSQGQITKVGFAIYDPTGQGELAVSIKDDISKILPGSTLRCANKGWDKTLFNCVAEIDATQGALGDYEVRINVKTTSKKIKRTFDTQHTLYINVTAVTL